MDEGSAVIAWAFGLLTGIALVYDSQAPQNTPKDSNGSNLPYIILQQQAFTDAGTAVDGTLGMGNMLLTVKVVTESAGFASAASLSRDADARLQQQTGFSNGVNIESCVREQRIRYVEDREGVRYNHCGSVFRVYVSAF